MTPQQRHLKMDNEDCPSSEDRGSMRCRNCGRTYSVDPVGGYCLVGAEAYCPSCEKQEEERLARLNAR